MENKNIKWNENPSENSIRTYTGLAFDLKEMNPDTICIEDIAHALSNTARFGGHLPKTYSVAQHSIETFYNAPPGEELEALMHDTSEAYIGDMPSPFKKMIPEYRKIEDKLMAVIAKKFGFEYPMSKELKRIDYEMYKIEVDSLVDKKGFHAIQYEDPEDVEREFLSIFYRLIKIKNKK